MNPPEEQVNPNGNEVNQEPLQHDVSLVDLLLCGVGMVLFLLDIGSDLWVGIDHFINGRMAEGGLVLALVILPLFFIYTNAVDLWHGEEEEDDDSSKFFSYLRVITFLLQVPAAAMYVEAIYYGHRTRWWARKEKNEENEEEKIEAKEKKKENYRRMLRTLETVAESRFLETVFEAAPQVLIQGYLTARYALEEYQNNDNAWIFYLQLVSISFSLLSIASSSPVYKRIRAKRGGEGFSRIVSAVQFIAHLFITMGRCLAFVLFMMVFHWWIVILVAIVLISVQTITFKILVDHCDILQKAFNSGAVEARIALLPFSMYMAINGLSRRMFKIVYGIDLVENTMMLASCFLLLPLTLPFILPVSISLIASTIGIFIGYLILPYITIATPTPSIPADPIEMEPSREDRRRNVTTTISASADPTETEPLQEERHVRQRENESENDRIAT